MLHLTLDQWITLTSTFYFNFLLQQPRPTLVPERVGIAHVRPSIYVAQPTSGSQFSAVIPSRPTVTNNNGGIRSHLDRCKSQIEAVWFEYRYKSQNARLLRASACPLHRRLIPSSPCADTPSAPAFCKSTHARQPRVLPCLAKSLMLWP
jgi:hypothetical protein